MLDAMIDGAIVVAVVDAIRSRAPAIDGWRVLALAAGVAVVIALATAPLQSWADLAPAMRDALVAWLAAIGVTATATRTARHASTQRTVILRPTVDPVGKVP